MNNTGIYRHIFIQDDGMEGMHMAKDAGGIGLKISKDRSEFAVCLCQEGDMYSREHARNILDERMSLKDDSNLYFDLDHYNNSLTIEQNCMLRLVERYANMRGFDNKISNVMEDIIDTYYIVQEVKHVYGVDWDEKETDYLDFQFAKFIRNKLELLKGE